MNEMYNMGLSIHSFGTVALLGVILINILYLKSADDLYKYKRKMSIFLMPLSSMALGIVIFTGVVMMAAKHLQFDIANIAMIFVSVVLIVLEAKRAKTLKYISHKAVDGLEVYRNFAMRIFYVEIVLIIIIGSWMWWLA
jgi:ethanolamine transporter EutH